jgi:hypothetical protein
MTPDIQLLREIQRQKSWKRAEFRWDFARDIVVSQQFLNSQRHKHRNQSPKCAGNIKLRQRMSFFHFLSTKQKLKEKGVWKAKYAQFFLHLSRICEISHGPR